MSDQKPVEIIDSPVYMQYSFAAGRATSNFLRSIKEGKLVGQRSSITGKVIVPPFRVLVDNLKATGNRLEVEVTSTSANAIRYYDREKVGWKNFHDINFVNQDYKPFNAANWPVADSGLIGPVTLAVATPLQLTEGKK